MTEATAVDAAFEPEVLAPVARSKKTEPAPIVMSQESLLELIGKMNEGIAEKLANALIESKKPYIDPAQESNKEADRASARRQRIRDAANKKADQDNCPHLAGSNSLSDQPDLLNRTSIIWHTSDSSETFGICTNCQRIFRDNDADYVTWRRRPSINKQSRAGERFFADPMRARAIARGEIASN